MDIKEIEVNEITTKEKENNELLTKDNNIQNQINVLQVNPIDLVKKEDVEFLQEHVKDFQDRFIARSYFRSMFELRHGVLSEDEHPTDDSKYYQLIGEQNVHLTELINLSFESRKLLTDIDLVKAQIEELEYRLSNPNLEPFEQKKLSAKIARKKIELEEKNYHITLQRKTAKERMREIRNSEEIIKELIPKLKYGTENFELHHAERYFKRYEKRMERMALLNPENREHVLSHFLSFAKAPENKQLTEEFVKRHSKDQMGIAVGLSALPEESLKKLSNELYNNTTLTNSNTENNTSKFITESIDSNSNNSNLKEEILEPPKSSCQIDFKSKEEMMEKDPVTKNFFCRKVHKILIATPHRVKEDKNVTNFYMMQTPSAFDCTLSAPYGLSVPDARNFVVDKAIKEDYEYIFFVDDDVLIPRNALVQLIHHFPLDYSDESVAVVGGFYYRKYLPLESVGMHEDKQGEPCRIENYKIGDIIHNTLVLPSGCTLFRTSVFKKMESPWYRSYTCSGRPSITEDTYVNQRIRDINGGDIITDTGVQCLHIDKQRGILYGNPQIVDASKNMVYENFREYFAV